MRNLIMYPMALLLLSTSSAEAHHKQGHHTPPGQAKKLYTPGVVVPPEVQFVCLITTEVAGDPHSKIIYSEWLPRAEAEDKADLGRSFVIYHPDLNTETACTGF